MTRLLDMMEKHVTNADAAAAKAERQETLQCRRTEELEAAAGVGEEFMAFQENAKRNKVLEGMAAERGRMT